LGNAKPDKEKMIHFEQHIQSKKKLVKAVGLLSGGLDSTLAVKIVKDLGVEIYGVYFSMPWGCCDKAKAMEAARLAGIKFIVLQLDERYLEMVKSPKHGYGAAMNPCVDCRVHMFSRAAQYMRHMGADFVFTGEVLGQRPMSQMRHSMKTIEKEAGLEGRLLRPLCAQFLEPTIPEQEGLIERAKLLGLSGRSRKPQIQLAKDLEITEYNQPGGGCLLTDKKFANRMRDTLKHGYRNFRETVALKWGRHFRINNDFKAIVGRDNAENEALLQYAHPEDHVMILAEKEGPVLLLKGYNPSAAIFEIAAGLIQQFSKYRDEDRQKIQYWPVADQNNIQFIYAQKLDRNYIDQIYI
jgi:tRNA U34 2-thiouridine synthase MnmA/TrmU